MDGQDNETRERLVRIETKVDTVLGQMADSRVAAERTTTDVFWLKGGMAIVLSIILSCAGWLAMQFFQQ